MQKILKDRSKIYGDYTGGSQFRVDIMELIKNRHLQVNSTKLDPLLEVYIFDIVNKLSRIAVTPTHVDSWTDIIGYSTRILEAIINANK